MYMEAICHNKYSYMYLYITDIVVDNQVVM